MTCNLEQLHSYWNDSITRANHFRFVRHDLSRVRTITVDVSSLIHFHEFFHLTSAFTRRCTNCQAQWRLTNCYIVIANLTWNVKLTVRPHSPPVNSLRSRARTSENLRNHPPHWHRRSPRKSANVTGRHFSRLFLRSAVAGLRPR